MKSESITIKDIAKALNLSYSSVSRALKGSHKISEDTIQKVKEYAQSHNYRPNLMAQGLKSKQSRSIGVMLSAVPNNFYAEVISGIESVASGKDYHVIISQSHESYEKEVKLLEHLQWRSVDGLLVSISTETEDIGHFENLRKKGVPIVFFDRVPEQIETHKVVADDAGGSYQLTTHLLEEGFKRIAHITSSPHLSITSSRLEGYVRALNAHGAPVDDNLIKYCLHGGKDNEEIEAAIDELFGSDISPDAIVTASDRITIKTFSLLKKRGLKIPGQVAIAGFSNFSAPELFDPSLTTVVQPAFDMGKRAMELLLQLIESKRPVKEFEKVVLPTELMIRASTTKSKDT